MRYETLPQTHTSFCSAPVVSSFRHLLCISMYKFLLCQGCATMKPGQRRRILLCPHQGQEEQEEQEQPLCWSFRFFSRNLCNLVFGFATTVFRLYFGSLSTSQTKKHEKKQKKPGDSAPAAKPIKHNAATFSLFKSLELDAPLSTDEVPALLEKLEGLLEDYKAGWIAWIWTWTVWWKKKDILYPSVSNLWFVRNTKRWKSEDADRHRRRRQGKHKLWHCCFFQFTWMFQIDASPKFGKRWRWRSGRRPARSRSAASWKVWAWA